MVIHGRQYDYIWQPTWLYMAANIIPCGCYNIGGFRHDIPGPNPGLNSFTPIWKLTTDNSNVIQFQLCKNKQYHKKYKFIFYPYFLICE